MLVRWEILRVYFSLSFWLLPGLVLLSSKRVVDSFVLFFSTNCFFFFFLARLASVVDELEFRNRRLGCVVGLDWAGIAKREGGLEIVRVCV